MQRISGTLVNQLRKGQKLDRKLGKERKPASHRRGITMSKQTHEMMFNFIHDNGNANYPCETIGMILLPLMIISTTIKADKSQYQKGDESTTL